MAKRLLLRNTILTVIASAVLITACKKGSNEKPEPEQEMLSKAKISLVAGDQQSGIYGDYLTKDITLKVTAPEGKKAEQYYVKFAMVQGNGLIDNSYGLPGNTSADGTFIAKWKLGCNTTAQKAKAYVYYVYGSTNKPVAEDSVEIKATGAKPTGWAKACGCNALRYDPVVVTHDKKTLYLGSGDLYSSTDGGINWDKVAGVPKWSEVVSAQFNSKGWLYVLTRYDGIYLSKDLKSWQPINNGLADMRDPTGFMVKDNVLMVSFYFDGPFLTTDNGGFWQKLLVSANSQRYEFFNQHSNGDLYLFDDWGTLFRSKDLGKTWQSLKLDYTYYQSQPYGFEIGPDGSLYIGSNDAIFAKLSPETLTGTAKHYYEWNSSSQLVSNISFYNNDVFYLVRNTPKPGIYSIGNNWDRINLDFPKKILAYFIKPNGSFLLFSEDGLYYKN